MLKSLIGARALRMSLPHCTLTEKEDDTLNYEQLLDSVAVASDWHREAEAHQMALPKDVFNSLTAEQLRKINSFQAVVLTFLPLRKRILVETAILNGFLISETICGTKHQIVTERRSTTLTGRLFGHPYLRFKDLLI